jgi:hypothetical protein
MLSGTLHQDVELRGSVSADRATATSGVSWTYTSRTALRLSKEDDVDLCIKSGLYPTILFWHLVWTHHTSNAYRRNDASRHCRVRRGVQGLGRRAGMGHRRHASHRVGHMRWIPFENGSGTRPSEGATVSQGAVSATILDIYGSNKDGPRIPIDGESGCIQVKDVTGGSFSAGALTISGCTADATGADEDDYRNGIYGIRSYGDRDTAVPIRSSMPL